MEGPPPIPQTLRGLWPRTPKSLGLPGPDPGHFLYGQKVTKSIGGGHFRLCPPPKDHPPQRPMRGLRPPLWILPQPHKPCEALPPSNRVNPPGIGKKRPRRGRSEANQRSVCRGKRRRSAATEPCRLRQDEGCGACADARPPLCRRGRGGHGGETPSKGFLPRACFCLLFPRGKSRSGCGGGTPTYHPMMMGQGAKLRSRNSSMAFSGSVSPLSHRV